MFWGKDQGMVSVRLYNQYRISHADYELLYQLHEAGITAAGTVDGYEDTSGAEEPVVVSAREVADRIPGLTGAEGSKELRRLAEAGHVEVDNSSSRGLKFKGSREISDYLSCTAYVPTLREAKRSGSSLMVMINNDRGNVMLLKDINSDMEPSGMHVSDKAFTREIRHLARQALKGEAGDNQLVMIAASDTPGGSRQVLVAKPFRFQKGRKQEPMIALQSASFNSDGGASLKFAERDHAFEDPFQHVLRAKDALALCEIIDDPVEAARPA